jgi:hypothetical protein
MLKKTKRTLIAFNTVEVHNTLDKSADEKAYIGLCISPTENDSCPPTSLNGQTMIDLFHHAASKSFYQVTGETYEYPSSTKEKESVILETFAIYHDKNDKSSLISSSLVSFMDRIPDIHLDVCSFR